MAMQLGHVHVKTREDPQKVAKFYIDNFGATVKRERGRHRELQEERRADPRRALHQRSACVLDCRARWRSDGADREGLRKAMPGSYTPAGGGAGSRVVNPARLAQAAHLSGL